MILGKEWDMFRQYLVQFSSECCICWSIELTLLLAFCVGVKFSVTSTEELRLWVCEAGDDWNICVESEVGIEGCRKLCSELHVCVTVQQILLT
jgi:hypothetical protein